MLQIAKALRVLVRSKADFAKIPIKTKPFEKKVSKIITKELLTPLEETRLAIEEIIIPEKKVVDLIPRSNKIRKLQHELINHYQLKGISVGQKSNRRLRIYPK